MDDVMLAQCDWWPVCAFHDKLLVSCDPPTPLTISGGHQAGATVLLIYTPSRFLLCYNSCNWFYPTPSQLGNPVAFSLISMVVTSCNLQHGQQKYIHNQGRAQGCRGAGAQRDGRGKYEPKRALCLTRANRTGAENHFKCMCAYRKTDRRRKRRTDRQTERQAGRQTHYYNSRMCFRWKLKNYTCDRVNSATIKFAITSRFFWCIIYLFLTSSLGGV